MTPAKPQLDAPPPDPAPSPRGPIAWVRQTFNAWLGLGGGCPCQSDLCKTPTDPHNPSDTPRQSSDDSPD